MLCRIAGHFPQIGEYTSGQEVGADKVRRTVMGAFLVVAADITVLLALVRLVSLLIHHTAAVCTEQYAGEQAHFIIAVGAFALLAKLLHPFPCLGVYDRLVVVLEYRLLFLRVFYAVLDFVRWQRTAQRTARIREENRQIFFVDTTLYPSPYTANEIIPEKKLYDFNLQVGDRMEYENSRDLPGILQVSHIDTILLEGIPRRKFYFDEPY